MADLKGSEPTIVVIVQEEGGGMKEELDPSSSPVSHSSRNCPLLTYHLALHSHSREREFLEGRDIFYSSLLGL